MVGCATVGSQFTPLTEAEFLATNLTRSDIEKRYGGASDGRTVLETRLLGDLSVATYHYHDNFVLGNRKRPGGAGGTLGAAALRVQTIVYDNDRVIGHFYSSSFPEDSTQFNVGSARNLKLGITKQAVEKVLGPASGSIRGRDSSRNIDVYFYHRTEFNRSGGVGLSGSEQTLISDRILVEYDEAGNLIDFEDRSFERAITEN